MFRLFLTTLLLSFTLLAPNNSLWAAEEPAAGNPVGQGGTVPSSSETESVPSTTSSATSSSTGTSSSGATSTAPSAEEQVAALNAFVLPTLSGHFSLSNINSHNEAALYISNDNGGNNLVYRVIMLIGMLVGTLAILLYIVAGYFMIFSQGDENQLTKGKQIVTYTSLGLVLVFAAYMIVQLVMGLMYFAG